MFQTTTKDLLYSLKPGDIFNIKVISSGEVCKFIFLKNKIISNDVFKLKIHTLKYLKRIDTIYLYDNDPLFSIEILK